MGKENANGVSQPRFVVLCESWVEIAVEDGGKIKMVS